MARKHLERIIATTPDFTDAPFALGRLKAEEGDFAAAQKYFMRCLVFFPASTIYWLDRGVCYSKIYYWRDAKACFRRAMACAPPGYDVLVSLATAELQLGEYSSALELLSEVEAIDRYRHDLWCTKGLVLQRLVRAVEALDCFDRATVLEPGNAESLYDSALLLLATGEFAEGWRRHEYRWRSRQFSDLAKRIGPISTTRARWLPGATAAPAVVLVWPEQGVGDEIMFGSMLGDFHRRVGRLLVQMDRRLIPLFRRSLPGEIEFVERGEKVAESRYESHLAMGSLGLYERPTLESFRGKGGRYLRAESARVERIRGLMGLGAAERAVGISWRSSNPETGSMRSVGLKELVVALRGRGVRLVNLQYGEVKEEIEGVYEALGERVWECGEVDNREDLDGLAALIEACDEVVSIGNATAHLAGALGKRTTVLLPEAPSWRWLAQGTTTPWYDGCTLIRKTSRLSVAELWLSAKANQP